MKLKMVGLGKMGFNLALNMKDHEVDVEGFDVNEEARKKAEESGIKSYETLKDTDREEICAVDKQLVVIGKHFHLIMNPFKDQVRNNTVDHPFSGFHKVDIFRADDRVNRFVADIPVKS